jgi:hypothetical protein
VERSRATFDAYDAVELRLEDRVVRVPPLTVGEAVRYLRLMDRLHSGDEGAHAEIMAVFPARAGIMDVPLSAWGLMVDVPGVGACHPTMTVAQALEFCAVLAEAQEGGWRAQAKVLDRTPAALGLPELSPVEVFGAARLFAGRALGSEAMVQFNAVDESILRANCLAYDTNTSEVNIFGLETGQNFYVSYTPFRAIAR